MSSNFKCKPAISRVKFRNSPTEALRFLDLIDISIWANSPTPDSEILKAIYEKIGAESARIWYRGLVNAVFPDSLSLNDFRRALLRDCHVENSQTVMTRYHDECSYFKSHEFLLKVNYHDSIEGLSDSIKFRDMKALEDQRNFYEVTIKLESIIAEKDERIKRLESRLFEKEGIVDFTIDPITRFGKRIEEARSKLKEELTIEGSEVTRHNNTPCQISPSSIPCNCQNPQNYVRPESNLALETLPSGQTQRNGPLPPENTVEPAADPRPLEKSMTSRRPRANPLIPQRENSVNHPRSFLDNIRFSNIDRAFSPRSSVATTTMDGTASVDFDELQAEWDEEIPHFT